MTKRRAAGLKRVLVVTGLARFIRTIRRYGSNVYGALFPDRQFEGQRRYWEQRWSSEKYSPIFERSREAIPREVLQMVEDQWVPTGGRILDIGCGSGWIASWLADQGYDVVGVDYSEAAVKRAGAAHPTIDGHLEWRQVDILHDPLPRTDFDASLDRGCLHRIPERLWPDYFRAVRSGSRHGARFLLLMATFEHVEFWACDAQMSRTELTEKVQASAAPYFVIDRIDDTALDLTPGDDNKNMPAVAFWMTARPDVK